MEKNQQLEAIRLIVSRWLVDPVADSTTSMNEIAAVLIDPRAGITEVRVEVVKPPAAQPDRLAELMDYLQRAIDRAEHKPELWAETRQSMGGVCTAQDSALAVEDRWGNFNHKRDAWLAVAAVRALPMLLEHIQRTEAGERAADQEVERLRIQVDDLTQQLAGERDAARDAAAERFREEAESRLSPAATDVLAERRRQGDAEGYTHGSDDGYNSPVLAKAAGCYILFADAYPNAGEPPPQWPWCPTYWKPKDFRRDLVRGAALVLAEIERLDRAEARAEARIDVIGQNGNDGEHYKGPAVSLEQALALLPGGPNWAHSPAWADSLWKGAITKRLYWVNTVTRQTERIEDGSSGSFNPETWTLVATRVAAP